MKSGFEEKVLYGIMVNSQNIKGQSRAEPFLGVWLKDLYARFTVDESFTIREVTEVLAFLDKHGLIELIQNAAMLTPLGREILEARQERSKVLHEAQKRQDAESAARALREEKEEAESACKKPMPQ